MADSRDNIYKVSNNDELLEVLHPVPDFENRDDIKPWLHEKLDAHGIQLVIERSDASKVVFKCKNLHRKTSTPRTSAAKLGNSKNGTKRVRTSPEDSCPFRLRVSYSVKNKSWAINIIKAEHNMSLCSNFGFHCGQHSTSSTPNTSTPSSIASHKRSWAYTPASTTSPVMSMINSPASTFTPASEQMEYDFDMRGSKRTRLSYESPLANQIDPLEPLDGYDDLNIAIAGDLREFNMVSQDDSFKMNQSYSPLENSLDYADFNLDTQSDNMLNSNQMFDLDINNQNHDDLYSRLNSVNSVNPMNSIDAFKPSSNLKLIGQTITEEEEDPLMYLLSSTNSRYSIEELESLDKAMGVDDNDQFLMSMFNKM